MASGEIHKLLLLIHASDQHVIRWYDTNDLPDGMTPQLIHDARKLGFLDHQVGNAWQEFEEVALTRKGKIEIGAPVSASLVERIMSWFGATAH